MRNQIKNNSNIEIYDFSVAEKRRSFFIYLFLMVFFSSFIVLFIVGGTFFGKAEVAQGYLDSRMLNEIDKLKLIAEFSESVFTDISKDHPNYYAILYLSKRSIISGYDGGEFMPDASVKRAEFMKMLLGVLNIYPHTVRYGYCFDDVADQWFAPYVCYAVDKGWVDGSDLFNPADGITFAEAVKIVANSLEIEVDAGEGGEEWFVPYMTFATEKGWLSNMAIKGHVDPDLVMSRAQVCELLFGVAVMELPAL